MISVQNNSEKTTGTGTGLRSRGKTQKRKKKIDEPSELSSSLGTREKGLFMPFYAFKKLDSLKAYGEFTGLPTIRPTSTTRGGGGGTRPVLG